jgi:hypothetical protein
VLDPLAWLPEAENRDVIGQAETLDRSDRTVLDMDSSESPVRLWRRMVLPRRIDRWSLTSLQQRRVKTGEQLVKHARYYWLLLAESHLTRRLFGAMLQRIWALPVPTG